MRHETHDGVVLVTIDDGRVNALSPAILAAIGESFDRAEADRSAIVLAGRPGRFSAGFDLGVIRAGGAAMVDMLTAGFDLTHRMAAHPMPVVVACTGHAIAMGSFLTIAADHRVGVADGAFRVQANEVAIGMAMPRAPIVLCRERLTPSAFQQAMVLARPFSHAEAMTAGWLDELAPSDEVVETAVQRAAEHVAVLHHGALALTKARVRKRFLAELRQAIADDDAELRALL